jgi:hypothetical protein
MKVARFVSFLSFLALSGSLLAGCGPEIPPAGNYATVAGKVVDATTSNPIAGATVSVNGGVLNAQTDSGGNFSVSTVPTGDWDYTASANGYASTGLVTNVPPLGPGEVRIITISLTKSS